VCCELQQNSGSPTEIAGRLPEGNAIEKLNATNIWSQATFLTGSNMLITLVVGAYQDNCSLFKRQFNMLHFLSAVTFCELHHAQKHPSFHKAPYQTCSAICPVNICNSVLITISN
jgi:hypothetical protein